MSNEISPTRSTEALNRKRDLILVLRPGQRVPLRKYVDDIAPESSGGTLIVASTKPAATIAGEWWLVSAAISSGLTGVFDSDESTALTALAKGDLLQYSASSPTGWVRRYEGIGVGTAGATALNNLSDVDTDVAITPLAQGDTLLAQDGTTGDYKRHSMPSLGDTYDDTAVRAEIAQAEADITEIQHDVSDLDRKTAEISFVEHSGWVNAPTAAVGAAIFVTPGNDPGTDELPGQSWANSGNTSTVGGNQKRVYLRLPEATDPNAAQVAIGSAERLRGRWYGQLTTGGFSYYLWSSRITVSNNIAWRVQTVVAESHTQWDGRVPVDASGFDGNLATTDDTLQKVAQKLDDLEVGDDALSDAQIGDKAFSNPPSDLDNAEKAAARTAIGAGTSSRTDAQVGDAAFSNPPSDLNNAEKSAVRTAIGVSNEGLTDAQIGDKAFSNPPNDLTDDEKTAARDAIGAGTGDGGGGGGGFQPGDTTDFTIPTRPQRNDGTGDARRWVATGVTVPATVDDDDFILISVDVGTWAENAAFTRYSGATGWVSVKKWREQKHDGVGGYASATEYQSIAVSDNQYEQIEFVGVGRTSSNEIILATSKQAMYWNNARIAVVSDTDGSGGSGGGGVSDYNALTNRPVLSNVAAASAATVGKLVLNGDDAELTRETVHHQQTAATATWADYSNAKYLGAFNTAPLPVGRSAGTWYFDIPHKRARLVSVGGPVANWLDAGIGAVISGASYIGEFANDAEATLHANAINNVYWDTTTQKLRLASAFTAASGTETKTQEFIRVATGEDVEDLQRKIDAAGDAFDADDARAALNLVFAEIQVEPAGVPGLVLPDNMALRLDGKLVNKTIDRIVVNLAGTNIGGVTRDTNPTPPATDPALPFNQTLFETSGGIINLSWPNAVSKRNVENTIQQTRQGQTITLQSIRGAITYTFTDGTTHEDIWHFGVANNAFDNVYTPPSDATPQAIGTASAGSSQEVARADHVHGIAANSIGPASLQANTEEEKRRMTERLAARPIPILWYGDASPLVAGGASRLPTQLNGDKLIYNLANRWLRMNDSSAFGSDVITGLGLTADPSIPFTFGVGGTVQVATTQDDGYPKHSFSIYIGGSAIPTRANPTDLAGARNDLRGALTINIIFSNSSAWGDPSAVSGVEIRYVTTEGTPVWRSGGAGYRWLSGTRLPVDTDIRFFVTMERKRISVWLAHGLWTEKVLDNIDVSDWEPAGDFNGFLAYQNKTEFRLRNYFVSSPLEVAKLTGFEPHIGGITPIAQGGTGANTAQGARVALGIHSAEIDGLTPAYIGDAAFKNPPNLNSTQRATVRSRIGLGALAVLNEVAASLLTGTIAAARIPNLAASKITSGVIAVARLGSGSPSASTFLRGDGAWAAVTASMIIPQWSSGLNPAVGQLVSVGQQHGLHVHPARAFQSAHVGSGRIAAILSATELVHWHLVGGMVSAWIGGFANG